MPLIVDGLPFFAIIKMLAQPEWVELGVFWGKFSTATLHKVGHVHVLYRYCIGTYIHMCTHIYISVLWIRPYLQHSCWLHLLG